MQHLHFFTQCFLTSMTVLVVRSFHCRWVSSSTCLISISCPFLRSGVIKNLLLPLSTTSQRPALNETYYIKQRGPTSTHHRHTRTHTMNGIIIRSPTTHHTVINHSFWKSGCLPLSSSYSYLTITRLELLWPELTKEPLHRDIGMDPWSWRKWID